MPDRRKKDHDRLARVVTGTAAAAVAVVGLVAVIMVKHGDTGAQVQASAPMILPAQPIAPSQDVVKAPPLAMGGARACANCGTVELVVAMHDHAKAKAKAYEMHIRMDDGKLRAIEQRGALAPGSRVVVEGNKVRALPAPG